MCCLGADDTIADACYGFHAGYGQAHASPKGRTLAADRPPSSQSPQVTALPAAHICLHTMQLLIAFIARQLGLHAIPAWEPVHVAEAQYRTFLRALFHHHLSRCKFLFFAQLPAAAVTSALQPHKAVAEAEIS